MRKSINPIAVAMDSAVKAQKYKKLTKEQQQQIIVDYLTGDFDRQKLDVASWSVRLMIMKPAPCSVWF
jgi:hypothetical protein